MITDELTRFGGQRIRVLLSLLALLLYVFTKISADLYAGALFIKLAMGLEGETGLYTSILILLAIAAIFTIGGGLSAVIWTDFVQTILMVCGSLALMIRSLQAVGGYEALMEKYTVSLPAPKVRSLMSISYGSKIEFQLLVCNEYVVPVQLSAFTITEDGRNESCSAVNPNFMHMLRPTDVGSGDLPWSGLITGMTLSSIWYWCADQVPS